MKTYEQIKEAVNKTSTQILVACWQILSELEQDVATMTALTAIEGELEDRNVLVWDENENEYVEVER